LDKIRDRLAEYGLDAILLVSEHGRFYASGFHSSKGMILLWKTGGVFLTDFRYIEAARERIAGAEVLMVTPENTYMLTLKELLKKRRIKKLGFEDGDLSFAQHADFAKELKCTLLPAQALIDGLRAVKEPWEIALMERAQRIAEGAFASVLKKIKPGVTERAIAAELTYAMLKGGADNVAFDPIVVAGPNSSMPHGVPGGYKLCPGDFVTLDFGALCGGYCSDTTRTVALGSATDEMRSIYAIVLRAQEAGLAAFRAGVPGRDVDAVARTVIEEAGYGDYFGHGFGHSLGIAVHEGPNAHTKDETPLPEGAVISAEPGIYLPGKFGVRIEDVVVVERSGCRNLTRTPKELLII